MTLAVLPVCVPNSAISPATAEWTVYCTPMIKLSAIKRKPGASYPYLTLSRMLVNGRVSGRWVNGLISRQITFSQRPAGLIGF